MTAYLENASFEGDAVAGDKIIVNRHYHLDGQETPQPPRELPRDTPGFTGRADCLARLDSLAAGEPAGREAADREAAGREPAEGETATASPVVIALTGMPGVGKTALAVHWAYRIAGRFPDGQIFIDLRGFSSRASLSPREALSHVLRALGVPAGRLTADEDELAALYRSYLSRKHMLLVLDDAADADQVRPLLPGGGSCVVVVTSRNDLAGLVAQDGARSVTLDLMPPEEALDLVRRIAGQERTTAEPEASAELVRRCGRLPLALRVAAANLVTRPQRSVAETVGALADGKRLSQLALGHNLDRLVGAAFDLSYQGLAPDVRRAFRQLGLVEGPSFTPGATAALLAITPEAAQRVLARLEAANLVQAVASDRYRFHELIREYARGRCEEEDERPARDAAVHRLARWYLTMAQQAGRFLDRHRRTIGQELAAPPSDAHGAERTRQLEWFTREQLNLIEVIGQTSRLRWDQLTWELADAVYDFFELRRYCQENILVHRLGFEAAERQHNLMAQFFMRHHMAVTYRELGDHQQAFEEAQESLRLSRRTQDLHGMAVALDNIARIQLRRSAYRAALASARESLRIRREIGDRHGEAATLDTMARVHHGTSEFRTAYRCAAEALSIRQEIGDRRGEAQTLDNIARAHHAWGRQIEALECAIRALGIRKELGDRHGEGETLAFVGNLYLWLGRLTEAGRYIRRALRMRRAIGDRHGEGQDLIYLSTVLRRMGRLDAAMRVGLEALDIVQELGDRQAEAAALDALSRTYRRKGLYDRSRRDAELALAISRFIGDRHAEATALNALALLGRRCGRFGQARRDATWSIRIRRQIGDRKGEASALDLLSKVFREMGMLTKAYRTAERAHAIEMEIGDWYGGTVTLRALGAISGELGDDREALSHLRRALRLEREAVNRQGEAKTLRLIEKTLARLLEDDSR